MTYTTVARTVALQESRALRGYARNGWPPPRCQPVNLWNEWCRSQKTSSTSFGKKAA